VQGLTVIPNYSDDAKMAEYGRYCARQKAIREARETVRDNAVRIQSVETVEELKQIQLEMNEAIDALIAVLELE